MYYSKSYWHRDIRRLHSLIFPSFQAFKVTGGELNFLQESCPSFATVHPKASAGQPMIARDGVSHNLTWVDVLLYRKWIISILLGMLSTQTQVFPTGCRNFMLHMVHKSSIAGHFLHRKTKWKHEWFSMGTDIRVYCWYCDIIFQHKSAKSLVNPALL